MPRFAMLLAATSAAMATVLFGGAVLADAAVDADVGGAELRSCVADSITANSSAADCVNRAHAGCLEIPPSAPAAAVRCFVDMKEVWGARIAARMEQIGAAASPDISAVAGIEVKYDLMQNLLQCDRMEELMRLRDDTAEAVLAQDARCEATATGLTYIKLLLQSRDIE